MSDLIDRQEAIVTAVRAAVDWHKLANPQYSIAYCIGEAMRQLPSAQPVIRCKDCKHFGGGTYCYERDDMWDENDFCSYAERKEQDDG